MSCRPLRRHIPAHPRSVLRLEPLEARYLLATLRVASWNTLNMPDTPSQDADFQTVLAAVGDEQVQGTAKRLDILALAESDPPSALRIRNVMNSLYLTTSYNSTTTSLDAGGDATGFVYDTSSVALMDVMELPGAFTHKVLRGQFRPVDTFGTADVYVYALHLKSGTDVTDVQKRESEMTLVRANADALGDGAHILFTGDFNMQSSSEGAWVAATNAGNGQTFDLANAPGNWSNNPSFRALHTQNTAFMLRRLDMHMASSELNDDTGLDYVDGSFHVFANNGSHLLGEPISTGNGASASVLTALMSASDHLPIVSDYFIPPSVLVTVDQTGYTTEVQENGRVDAYRVALAIAPASDVVISLSASDQLDLGNGPGQPIQLTFTAANWMDAQTVVVAAADDSAAEGTHREGIQHTITSSDARFQGLQIEEVTVYILDDEAPSLVINEVDSDTTGIDTLEFVELFDGGQGNRPLDGLTLVLYDGATDASYAAFDLDGFTTDAAGYFVLGSANVPGVDRVIPNDTIQNGADAIALFSGDSTSFPAGSPITTVQLLDAVVYDTDDGPDPQLLALLAPLQSQVNENANGLRNSESVSRFPDSGIPRYTDNLRAALASPDAPNVVLLPGATWTESAGSTHVSEGGVDDSYRIVLESYPSADVLITIDPDPELDLGAGPGTPLVIPFTPNRALVPRLITVRAVDDSAYEGSHTGIIRHTVSSSDAAYDGLTLGDLAVSISDNDIPPLVINEVDSDTPGTDTAEFVELYDGGRGNTRLDGLAMVFFNGATDEAYAGFDLDGFSTDASGYFVLGNATVPGVDFIFASNTLQNGTDAVALYQGDPASFVSVTTTGLLDALVYDTDDGADPGLLALLLPGQPQINESALGDSPSHAMARRPDGGTPRVTSGYVVQTPTPGQANGPAPVDGDFDQDGDYDCQDVDNLVAAIAAALNPAAFDLTGDFLVNGLDLTAWLAEAGNHNLPSGQPYLLGDANLNGLVDGSDFSIWNANKFTFVARWCAGDFTANGLVDGSDFNVWNATKFTASDMRANGVSRSQTSAPVVAIDGWFAATEEQLQESGVGQRIGHQVNPGKIMMPAVQAGNGHDRGTGSQARTAAVVTVLQHEQFPGCNSQTLANRFKRVRVRLAAADILRGDDEFKP